MRDLANLAYVGELGGGSEIPFLREKAGCAFRHHVGYARGYEKRWYYRRPLAALFADSLEIRKDIQEEQLEEDNPPNEERQGFNRS